MQQLKPIILRSNRSSPGGKSGTNKSMLNFESKWDKNGSVTLKDPFTTPKGKLISINTSTLNTP
jgi:hypothetical protein